MVFPSCFPQIKHPLEIQRCPPLMASWEIPFRYMDMYSWENYRTKWRIFQARHLRRGEGVYMEISQVRGLPPNHPCFFSDFPWSTFTFKNPAIVNDLSHGYPTKSPASIRTISTMIPKLGQPPLIIHFLCFGFSKKSRNIHISGVAPYWCVATPPKKMGFRWCRYWSTAGFRKGPQAQAPRSSAQLQRPDRCSHRPSPAPNGWREPGDPGERPWDPWDLEKKLGEPVETGGLSMLIHPKWWVCKV